jgi:hypothetical protein
MGLYELRSEPMRSKWTLNLAPLTPIIGFAAVCLVMFSLGIVIYEGRRCASAPLSP